MQLSVACVSFAQCSVSKIDPCFVFPTYNISLCDCAICPLLPLLALVDKAAGRFPDCGHFFSAVCQSFSGAHS